MAKAPKKKAFHSAALQYTYDRYVVQCRCGSDSRAHGIPDCSRDLTEADAYSQQAVAAAEGVLGGRNLGSVEPHPSGPGRNPRFGGEFPSTSKLGYRCSAAEPGVLLV